MHMHAANNNGIKMQGAIVLRFTGRSLSGQTLETHQIVYVTSDAETVPEPRGLYSIENEKN